MKLSKFLVFVPYCIRTFSLLLGSFLDAEQVLLQMSLIDKSIESGIICMHRLVQTAVMRRMSPQERQEIFSVLVNILATNLPDTYSADVGHQVSSWSRCERSLPHLESIVERNKDYKIFPDDNQPFAELLLRFCWYVRSTVSDERKS